MCFYYDETPEFYSDKICKAKRDHACDGCRNGIVKGEFYYRASGKYDGSFYTLHVCGACELDRHRIHIIELADGCDADDSWCPPDQLGETLPEYGMDRSSREDGQRWFRRQMATGQRGVGTEAGWNEWAKERQQLEVIKA